MRETTSIAGEIQLSADERRSLRCLVGIMIPASKEYGVPGADDDAIFSDIVASLGPDARFVSAALGRLDALCGGSFADQGSAGRQAACEALRNESSPLVAVLVRVTVQCYYRDDHVMRSLNMEPRPPYPLGFEVESGDWSLLDPVRARGKIYRDVPGGSL
jgi:hypothetical protein